MRGLEGSDRARLVRRVLAVGGVLFLLAVIQTTVFGRWKLFGAVPDLMLCCVVLLGFLRGREEGAISGIAAGFFIAALGSVGVTVAPVFYMLCGYVCGFFARAVYPKSFVTFLPFLAASLPAKAVETVLSACLRQPEPRLGSLLVWAVLPEAAGTFLCGMALFFPIRAVLGREKKR